MPPPYGRDCASSPSSIARASPHHQRIARRPALPTIEQPGIRAPRKCGELGAQRLVGRMGEMKQDVVREFAPAEFPDIGAVRVPHGMPDLARADFAEVQMGRKTGCARLARKVPLGRIYRQVPAREVLQLCDGSGLSWSPGRFQPAGPIDARLEAQVPEYERGGPSGWHT